jgi:hypothetical protein
MPTLNVSRVWQTVISALHLIFQVFPSKFEMPIYMKVVSLIKIYNFHKGRILSVLVNFGERGKSSGRHLWTLGWQWV